MGRKRSTSSEGGSGVLFAVALVIYLVVTFIWWIVAVAVAVALFYLVRAIVEENRRRRAVRARRCAEIAARADQQHNWVMRGDDRGVYGPEGAALMRTIRARPRGLSV
ncbi:MAG: hypothetical protein FGM52_10655 [Mycobacterium sp.]|nr:hypothetical protein [Mycobacterium sp.]